MATLKLHKFASLDAVTKQNENQNEMCSPARLEPGR